MKRLLLTAGALLVGAASLFAAPAGGATTETQRAATVCTETADARPAAAAPGTTETHRAATHEAAAIRTERVRTAAPRTLAIVGTTCEMQAEPLALETDHPRFGWRIAGPQGTMQAAYAVEVRDERGRLVWESGRVDSEQSQLVPYGGEALRPLDRYRWRVRVWDRSGAASDWSAEASFRLAPAAAWMDAAWIGAITQADAKMPAGRNYHGAGLKEPAALAAWDAVDSLAWRSILLRKEFTAEKPIAEATVYVSGLGHYELTVNGRKAGDSEFAPLWSDYHKRVYYNAYDVTELLYEGANALGVLLGNGFYNVVDRKRYRKLQIGFGPETLHLKLRIRYADGTERIVASDGTWRYDRSPITFNTLYGGEDYDARLEQTGWDCAGFDESRWRPVVVQEPPRGALVPQQAPPVKIMRRYGVQTRRKLTPEEVAQATKETKRTVDPSALLLDMGQNLAGFPEIVVRGRRGQRITLVVAEAVTDSHAANQRQTGRQHYYTYILKGDGVERWHPRFSYYGFRYIQLEGAVLKGMKNPAKLPVVEQIHACFVHNSAAEIGSFACSNPIFNAAHRLIHNAVRSNMQAVWTDCPHREKLGWLEQVHLNGPGLLYNYDLATYLPKVLRDIRDAQQPDGMVPTTAPRYVIFEGPGMDVFADSPEWSATLVESPFQYYATYGDDRPIRDCYPQMRRWVDYLGSRAEGHLIDFGLGDWYDYGDFRAGFSRNTPVGLVASAHYILALDRLIEAARLVGNAYDADRYAALRGEVVRAFNAKYFDPATHRYGTGSQTSLALPLYLGIVPEGHREAVLRELVADIERHGTRLTTGDVGNRYLFRTLADNGLDELMYRMHDHEEAPGYGFQLRFGATTLTEQWDPRQGSSWNHFMMGQIDEWFFRSLAGLRPDPHGEGYRLATIAPQPVGDLKHLEARYDSLYGPIAIEWQREGDRFTLAVELPANCRADVLLPGDRTPQRVESGRHTFTKTLR